MVTAHSFGRDAETAEFGPNLAMMGGEQGAKRQKVSSEEVRVALVWTVSSRSQTFG